MREERDAEVAWISLQQADEEADDEAHTRSAEDAAAITTAENTDRKANELELR